MFGTEKPWLKVYEGHLEPDSAVFGGSLHDLFRESVERHRGKTALTFHGTEFTFERLQALVEQMAASLAAGGVGKGDRVALMLPTCPQYVISFLAAMRLGAVVTQVNPTYVEREISHLLEDSGAETIVVHDSAYPRVKAVLAGTNIRDVIVVSLAEEPENLESGHRSFGDFLEMDAEPAPEVGIDPVEDLAALQYTGGTTGVSKGAMLTHRNLAANVRQSLDMFVDDPAAFEGNPRVIGALPFFHIYGLTYVMFLGIVEGLNQLLLPRFDVDAVLDLFLNERPVMFSGVPTMYMALNASGANLRKHRLHEVRTYTAGGAALPVNLKRSFEDKTGRSLFEGYGLSEASPVTHFNPSFAGAGREGSVGIPIPSTDARIVDVETGEREMSVGESGELIVRGPQVMKGYWNMPDETANTLRDDWLYTGDIARMEEDGYFYIVDRTKDMILASGYNVYPREIEEVLFAHEAVAEAVAIGISDEYRGESVKAFVVRRKDAAVTEADLIEFCQERLAPYKTPKSLEFRDELPKSAVGKLLRRVLVEEERAEGVEAGTGTPPPPLPS